MKRLMNYLLGMVRLTITGPFPERLINLCAQHRALASCRVTAQCFEYGHAAGIAADMAIRQGRRLRDIDGRAVRAAMDREGSALD